MLFRSDCNRGWTVGEAIQVSQACAHLKLAIEQPCATYAECAIARPHLRHPLLLDECAIDLATVATAIGTGVADGFGMKLTRVGGISAMRAIRDLCEATNTPTSCDDSWGGDIIAAACVHVGATLNPKLSRGAWISDPYQVAVYLATGQVREAQRYLYVCLYLYVMCIPPERGVMSTAGHRARVL